MDLSSRPLVLSFDCYGTLVDWEEGIWAIWKDLDDCAGRQSPSRDEVLAAFASEEAKAEASANRGNFLCYREVLQRTYAGMARHWGWEASLAEKVKFATSVGDWPLYPDTVTSLQKLAMYFPVHILSNIDADLFAETQEKLPISFASIWTADNLESYKPATRHFEAFLSGAQVEPHQVLHVAQSLFHDIAPASSLGFQTVWIDRRGGKGGGATPTSSAKPDYVFSNLKDFADQLCCLKDS